MVDGSDQELSYVVVKFIFVAWLLNEHWNWTAWESQPIWPPSHINPSASYWESVCIVDFDYTYYKCPNPDVGSAEQELINIFEHKLYLFYINL